MPGRPRGSNGSVIRRGGGKHAPRPETIQSKNGARLLSPSPLIYRSANDAAYIAAERMLHTHTHTYAYAYSVDLPCRPSVSSSFPREDKREDEREDERHPEQS